MACRHPFHVLVPQSETQRGGGRRGRKGRRMRAGDLGNGFPFLHEFPQEIEGAPKTKWELSHIFLCLSRKHGSVLRVPSLPL